MTNANHQEKPNRGSWLCGRLGQFTAMCATVLCAFSVSAETYYLAGTDASNASAMIGTGSYGWTDSNGTTTKTHNPSEGNDYVVAGNGQTWANLILRTPTVTGKTFGGDSLTLKGKAEIKVKVPNSGVVTIPNLIIDGEAQIVHGDGDQVKAVDGAITVNEMAYLKIVVNYDTATGARKLDIRSSISGSGEIWSGLDDDKTGKTPFVKFSGSMADFTGKLTFQSGKNVASEVYFYNDLPGDPAEPLTDGFTLVGKPVVKFMSSGTLGYTRGIALPDEVCEIYVEDGQTVQINGLVTGAAGFKKTGAGTLALASASPGLSGTISVAAGTLQLCDIKENALPNATVTVSSGATLDENGPVFSGRDMLLVTGEPSPLGVVSPAYGKTSNHAVGESFVCSAPAAVTNAEGNVGYDCMGYKVYTNDVVYVAGEGNCFTYVHPDCETGAKLVWYWDFNSFTAASGDWSDPDNWSAGRVPTAEDNVVIDGKAVTAEGDIVAKSLVLRGAKASLTLGRTGTFKNVYYTSLAQPVSLTLAGSLAVTDGAKLYVYPGELEDVKTAFADTSTVEAEAAVIAKIYAAANIVSVGGDFTVSNGATVYPANALLSSVPVFFKVKGDFTLAADASFDAKLRGWGWDMGAVYDDAVAAGFQVARRVNADGWKDVGFSLALGSGQNYSCGGGYGGNGMGAGTSGKVDAEKRRNGYAYGYRAAPFLSGGPGGHQNADNRGSGSICVFAEGVATVNGTLNADSSELSHGKASGGGIWIAGQSVSLGLDAVLTAKGGSVNSTYAAGGGGRIAIAQGLEQKDLDLFAAGEEPDGFTIDALSHAGVSVAGGVRNNDQKTAQAGTAVLVSNPNVFETVTVTANDTSVIGPAYGDQPVRAGVNHFEAPAYGADAADPEKSIFRYACLGYVLTNGAGETVAQGPDASFEATIVKGAGPYTLTWAWGPRESHIVVIRPASELGMVSVDGVILESDFDAWFATTEAKTVVVEPVEDAEFLVWRGDVARGDERKATLTITTDRPQTLRPVLTTAGEPKTCVWKSNAKGEWYAPANWTGGVIPSSADTAQLANGTCEVYGALEVGSIIQTDGTLAIASADEICVAGDWTMSGNAKLNVTAQPIDATHTFETGTTCVRVGGNLTLNGTAVLTVISDHWTGGSPVFRVGGVFTLAEGAKVTADGQGFSWRIAEGGVASEEALFTTTCDGKLWETMAVAPGNSYQTMGSYGGKGGGSSRATYGWANAPIHPGSPAGRYGGGNFYNATSGFGGGLIRIHAAEAVVAGTLTANGAYEIASVNYGCASGGGIWLTADAFDFAATAKLAAHGAYTSYGGGGGGRIAIGTGLTSAQVDALLTTGRCGRKAHGLDVFTNEFAEVTVNVRGGEADGTVEPVQSRLGTFSYYGKPKGMLIIIK